MFQLAEAGGEGINFHTGDAKPTLIGPGLDGRQVARPLYYGMLMFKEAARGAALLPARLVAPGLNMAAYATRAADGTLKVCLINKDLERGARVGIGAGRHFAFASLLRLTAPSAEARTDVTFGGSAVDDFGQSSLAERLFRRGTGRQRGDSSPFEPLDQRQAASLVPQFCADDRL
jgi:hypothetical protein